MLLAQPRHSVTHDATPLEQPLSGLVRISSGDPDESSLHVAHPKPRHPAASYAGERERASSRAPQLLVAAANELHERFVSEALEGNGGEPSCHGRRRPVPEPVHHGHQGSVGELLGEVQVSGLALTRQRRGSHGPLERAQARVDDEHLRSTTSSPLPWSLDPRPSRSGPRP
jgi:hypothetical protein